MGYHPAVADHGGIYHRFRQFGALDHFGCSGESRGAGIPVLYVRQHLLDVFLVCPAGDVQHVYCKSKHHGKGVLSPAGLPHRNRAFQRNFLCHTIGVVPADLAHRVLPGGNEHPCHAEAADAAAADPADDGFVCRLRPYHFRCDH